MHGVQDFVLTLDEYKRFFGKRWFFGADSVALEKDELD